MTGRERLVSRIQGGRVDRIPVAPFIWSNYVRAFFQGQVTDLVEATVHVYDQFGFDVVHRTATPQMYLDYEHEQESKTWQVAYTRKPIGDDDSLAEINFTTPKGNLQRVIRYTQAGFDELVFTERYPVEQKSDLDCLERFQPPVPHFDVSLVTRAKEAVGDRGIVAPWIQGVFNLAGIFYRRYEDLMVDALTDTAWYSRLMNHCLQRALDHARVVARARPDAVSYGGNLAGGAVGAAFFKRFVCPYEVKLIDYLKEQGILVIYHNCGNVGNLLPVYGQLPIDVFESLTEYPYGDINLPEALTVLEGKALMGNLDHIEFLVEAKPREIHQAVKNLLDTTRHHHRFILGTSDYISEQTPRENLVALAEAGIEWGRRLE